MAGSLLSAANWPIVGQICWLLGKVMNFIYTMLDNALTTDTGLVGISIILYTILVYTDDANDYQSAEVNKNAGGYSAGSSEDSEKV